MTVDYFTRHFKTIMDGEPWYGESTLTKLRDITDDQAFMRPEERMHSIAELVAHMTYWRTSLVKRLEGDYDYKGSMESEHNWPGPDKLQGKGWEEILMELDATQEKIIALLPRQTESWLERIYAREYTHRDLVQGVLDHDIYHLGQIGIVKKLVCHPH